MEASLAHSSVHHQACKPDLLDANRTAYVVTCTTDQAPLIQSHLLARIFFELSRNLN